MAEVRQVYSRPKELYNGRYKQLMEERGIAAKTQF
jgi:hypothetical protein